MKHFRATHKKTGEQILFGVEDIFGINNHVSDDGEVNLYIERGSDQNLPNHCLNSWDMLDWLDDHTLEYQHEGEWFDYE